MDETPGEIQILESICNVGRKRGGERRKKVNGKGRSSGINSCGTCERGHITL
jgi:hypothetical protein